MKDLMPPHCFVGVFVAMRQGLCQPNRWRGAGGWLIDDVACGSFRYQLPGIDGLQLRRDQPAILPGPTTATHPWRRTALDAPLATYAALFAHLAGERQLEGAEQPHGAARAEICAAAGQVSARQTWI